MTKVFTTPKVRKFAREIGIDLSGLKGSERKGRISENDVKNFAKNKFSSELQQPKKIAQKNEFGEIEIIN